MGKRIIQQARGHGSLSYRVRKQAYVYRIRYPRTSGEATVSKLVNSPAHTSPLAKIMLNGEIFYTNAIKGLFEGQKIMVCQNRTESGDIEQLKNIPFGKEVCLIESKPFNGPDMIRTSGSSGKVVKKEGNKIIIQMPSKKEVAFNEKSRATIGIVSGEGRLDKPIVKAGKAFYMKKTKNKLWPRTSAVKMNIVDHPFGSGRGKRKKSKIAKRNAPPGARVGTLRPRRTGRLKR
jgi:large subunit ribosomal protein L2